MDLFFQNYFCKIPQSNVQFVVISKNACTYLKKIALSRIGLNLTDSKLIHDTIGYSENHFLTRVHKSNTDDIKIAVYRDPVSRLKSVYEWFVLDRQSNLYFAMSDVYSMDFDRFLDFVERELCKSNPLLMDEHIRPQSDYYKDSDVDYIIDIKSLDEWLLLNGIQTTERQNESIVKIELTETQIERIKKLYEKDFKLIKSEKYVNLDCYSTI